MLALVLEDRSGRNPWFVSLRASSWTAVAVMFLSSRLTYLPFTWMVLSVWAELRWPHPSHLFSFGGGHAMKEVQVQGERSLEEPKQATIMGDRGEDGRGGKGRGGHTGEGQPLYVP